MRKSYRITGFHPGHFYPRVAGTYAYNVQPDLVDQAIQTATEMGWTDLEAVEEAF